ncbi:Disease resistance protein [Corchorus olitorius]|uniref:Disease resistance protein n=1 Tax=Corchorus olitorius TaxID=93759 RepID=A0A1R3J1D0_9ROSI|nr:Disease resistance protein [Corchorus olitorius]
MDPILTGATANLTSKAAKGIFQEARRYIRYAFIYKKNVNKFEENRKTLMAKREGVQQEIGSANRKAEKIKADVEDWCNRVDKKMEEEEKKVKDLHDKAKNKCCIGLCPNINRRYQLSRQAEEVATAFDGLRQQGEFNRVSYQDVPEESVGGPPKDFEAFESRQEVFNDIMEALKDATIGMIGVYGMPGVGKTTLVNEVSRQVKKGKLFDAVITAVVKQRPDIRNIQDQIAESVGLKFEEQSVTGRARRLCGRLKKEKKIVVILDDLWARLDLKEVGIPFGDDHRGCKAWGLFKKMAGDNFESSELHPKATEAADKCAGSPLAIATVGRALRNKNLYAWNDALRKLQRPSTTDLTGILEHAYSAIKLSYDYLSEELKQTFLLYSLLGRHVGTLDLLKYSMGLGLFHGVNTVEETRDRLLTVLSDLKASCLLDDCKYCIGHLVMHDLTYDAALAIASKENNVFALKHADVLRDWPDRERMKMFNKISLKASISKLPEGLHCPQLSFFQLFSKDPNNCVEMPSNFFKDMENIKVLDLTRMHFSSLPSSIRVLSNLRTLCLDICVLEDIALVGELKTLETLSLMKSDIKVLPQEIGQLTQLKLFDLTGCTKLKMIPPGVLSRLSGLEELYMGNSFVDWEAERQANQQTNATLAELKLLSCLTSLEIHIPDAEIMPEGLFSENLRRYKVFIGKSSWDWDANKYEYSRTLRLELDRSIDHLDHGIKMLLKKTEDLYLDDMRGAKIALHGLLDDDEGFQHLKNLQIRNCADIQYIINDDKGAAEFRQLRCLALESMVFHFLENLRLSSINVEMIWNHPLSNNSFSSYQNLTSLIVEGCGNLKQLLSSSMARSLVKLEYFEISGCKKLKEIIFFEEGELREEEAAVSFPQLKSLKIKKLQLLMGFCSQDYRIEFPSLKLLEIEQCPKLKQFIYKSTAEENKLISSPALFDDKVGLPNVEKVRITHLRMKKIWNNQLSVNSFCKLTDMSIKYCQALATIFPCDMWSTFQRLQALRVCGCDSLEEIFDLRSLGSDMEETQVLATQFRELHIHDLPKLKQIWSKDPRGILTFEKLDVVQVLGCGSLEKVFPASVARALSQLKDLDINDCGVKEIVSKEEGSSEERITFKFDKLSSLTLWDLKKLKCFYPGLHTIKCPKLIKLKAWHCNNVRIFGTELMNDDQRDSPIQAQQPLFLVEKV